MREIFILVLFIFAVFTSKAQLSPYFSFQDNYFLTEDSTATAMIWMELFQNSNALPNRFVNKFFQGGFIDNQLKDEASGKLKASSRAGLDFNMGFAYMQPLQLKEGEHSSAKGVSIKSSNTYGYNFTPDAFRLFFYGNKLFEGDTALAHPVSLHEQSFLQINMHLVNYKGGSWVTGVGAGFHAGNFYYRAHLDTASLYTAPDGDSLHFRLKGIIRGLEQYHPFAGLGASVNFFAVRKAEPFNIYFSISDLGFTSWFNQGIVYRLDTAGSFTGVDFNDFVEGNLGFDSDTLIDEVARASSEDFLRLLPFKVKFSLSRNLSQRSLATAGVFHQYGPASLPLAYLCWYYKPAVNFAFQTGLSYGGYGGSGLNAGVFVDLPAQFRFSLNTWHLEGFFFPDDVKGQSLLFSFSRNFN